MKASKVSLILLALVVLLTAPLLVFGETEPNNSKAEADTLTSGMPMTGQMMSQSDQDWFCVVTSGPEDIPVTFSHEYVGYQFNQYYVSAYDDLGNQLLAVGIYAAHPETTFILGSGSAGKYYIVVKPCTESGTYSQCSLHYSDQYTLKATFKAPTSSVDLSVTSISVPSTGTVGQVISILNAVKNRGTNNAPAFLIGLYLSKDKVIDPVKDRLLGGRSLVSGLKAGTISQKTTLVAVPDDVAAGLYYVGAVVDLTNAVGETNEGNNSKASVTQIQIVQ